MQHMHAHTYGATTLVWHCAFTHWRYSPLGPGLGDLLAVMASTQSDRYERQSCM